MKTRDEFVNAWKLTLAGLALFGVASERIDGPTVRAAKIWDVPNDVQRLIGIMYDSLDIRCQCKQRTVDEEADLLIAMVEGCGEDARKVVIEKLRKAFSKNGGAK